MYNSFIDKIKRKISEKYTVFYITEVLYHKFIKITMYVTNSIFYSSSSHP